MFEIFYDYCKNAYYKFDFKDFEDSEDSEDSGESRDFKDYDVIYSFLLLIDIFYSECN